MSFYSRWMLAWEEELNSRVTTRKTRPFGWGVEYLHHPLPAGGEKERLFRYADWALENSEDFYAIPAVPEFSLEGDRLTFPSAVAGEHRENNLVHGRYYPCDRTGAAVIVLPQWNADNEGHLALCRLLNRFGLSALRLSLPYHDYRRPAGMDRADGIVDANIGRTLQANRQAVLDVRLALEWLLRQGHRSIGIVGTSLGACVAFLTFVHEPRLVTAIYNLGSSWFPDVVWNGNTTPHVREGLEGNVTPEELRRLWAVISPFPLIRRMHGQKRPQLLISGRYDRTFLPEQTAEFVAECRRWQIPLRQIVLPCGHYTLGRFPFNWTDGLIICRYLRRQLKEKSR